MDPRSKLLERYYQEAVAYLKEGRVLGIEFAGPTYQVEVLDKKDETPVWPFLKLGDGTDLQDAFCSCDQADGEGMCPHLATALLYIYHGSKLPLHQRFEGSLWNKMGQMFALHLGYDPYLLNVAGKKFIAEAEGRKLEILAQNTAAFETLKHLVYQKKRETEENSIKFSNLTLSEIQRWREGRPSKELRYLLSFWYDLAAYFMLLQEQGGAPTVSFKEVENLPTQLHIIFSELELFLSFLKEDLADLIPSFAALDSPLKIKSQVSKKIKAITYDPEKVEFHVDVEEIALPAPTKGIKIDGWSYLAGVGFIAEEEGCAFEKATIPREEIAGTLDKQKELFKKFLVSETVHDKSLPLKYKIYFDKEWNWRFEGYLFEEGDLTQKGAVFFGTWAYLPKKGFFPIYFSLFNEASGIVSPYLVSSFIDEHQIWLRSQPGFEPHLAGIETQMSYHVDENGALAFKTAGEGESLESRDFGEWIYTPGEGFYSKSHSRIGLAIRPGLKISFFEVADFIKTHLDELETLPGFFLPYCPIQKRGLSIKVLDEQSVLIEPISELLPIYEGGDLLFYGDYVYLKKHGFFQLPLNMRLPARFRDPLKIGGDPLHYFLRFELDPLLPFVTYLDKRLKRPHKIDFELAYLVKNPQGGLKARIFLKTETGRVDLSTIKEAIEKKKRFCFTDAGLIDLNAESLLWLKNPKVAIDAGQQVILLSTMEFLRADSTYGFLISEDSVGARTIIEKVLHELRTFATSSHPDLKGLTSILRPYQKTGLAWLWFLYHNDLSGILCDEMGLGKTHQAMALIAAILNLLEKKEGRFLVVCPTSVIYHWHEKLQKFLPKLKVHLFHGQQRSLKNLPKKGLLLTSYGISRTENERLKKIPFELAIFDELQIAKNPHSLVHKALSNLDAKMRVGLTGTPIENRLKELKALFDIVLPGYMPKDAAFREMFINPIERGKNEEKKLLLQELIRPFVLRRKKKEVLAELPAKSEEKSLCFLSKEQAHLYGEVLKETGSGLVRELQQEALPVSYVHIFAILSKLKQICNHPALLKKDPKNYKNYKSGKWELFVELLGEAIESGQKVVVFSQYLMMLDIIEDHVREKGWGYAGIRGDTLDRPEQIRRFQEDPDCHVFIGSLGAAGLGIDLTAASTVILYDRWWNAARENQAIDRVHRIGQKWAVQVYKLIAKGTIEEKIDQMVEKKHKLMEEVIAAEDQDMVKTFTRSELIDLLTFLPSEEEWEEES